MACERAEQASQATRGEAGLRHTLEELTDFVEHGPLPLHWVGSDGTILWANQAELHLLGYTSAEYIGHHITEFHADRAVLDDILQRLTRHETLRDYEARLRCKDGSTRYVLISSNVLWQDGQFVHARCFTRDITERRQAEQAVRRKAGQLQAITECMTRFLETGNWRESSKGILRAALEQTQSECGFLGVVLEGPVLRILAHEGIVWDSRLNRELYERVVQTYQEVGYVEFTNFHNLFGRVITSGNVIISNEPSSDPCSDGLPPGHPPLHHFMGVPMRRGTEVVGMVAVANRPGGYAGHEQHALEILMQAAGVLYDNYRREQREAQLGEQLRLSQRMEAAGRLAAGIAHDFNNLLTVINGFSQLLLARLGQGDPLHYEIEHIHDAGVRAAALTQQLLTFSRKGVLSPKVLDLNAVVADMERLLRRLIGEDITLVTSTDPALWRVKADTGQIEQVLMNLAVNARDAMPKGGKITIETKNVEVDAAYARMHAPMIPGPYVMLAVSDTGCGMDKETQARISERFFTTKEQGKGAGLGLTTVYGIIKESGGYIWVYSEPGKGTAFTVYLPPLNGEEKAAKSGQAPAKAARGSETILLVEDEDMVRNLAQTVLQRHGYTVLVARDGAEAVRTSQEHAGPIHLLLSDTVMPGMSGQETADRVATVRRETKVLYMSGYTDEAIVQHGVLAPGAAFIEKPFTPDGLVYKVHQVLNGKDEAPRARSSYITVPEGGRDRR